MRRVPVAEIPDRGIMMICTMMRCAVVIREGRGSVSLLQRALGIGYGRAARMIDYMAEDGIVGDYNGAQAREVVCTMEEWEQAKADREVRMNRSTMKALVTGGGGFLGLYIVEQLRAAGHDVRVFSRGHYPALTALSVETQQGDLRDVVAVERACEGIDAVFHVAAVPGVWGPWETYHSINTTGTLNVISGCRRFRCSTPDLHQFAERRV